MKISKKITKRDFRFGIATKIALVCIIVVIAFLFISNFVFLKLQSNLVSSIIGDNEVDTNNSIETEVRHQSAALMERMKANTRICATIASTFLYNIDPDGLQITLQPYMELSEIHAIVVTDYLNKPFFAFWRDNGVKTGAAIPDSVSLNKSLSATQESFYQNEKVGTINLYVTDELLIERLNQNKEKAKITIAAFRKATDKKLRNVMIIQATTILGVVLILIFAITLPLRIIAIKPIRGLIERFKDMAEGEGDLTVRLDVQNRDEIGELSFWFNTFIIKIQRIIADVAQDAAILNDSSKLLADISDLMASSAGQTSNKTMAVASASNQMSTMISMVAKAMEDTTSKLTIVASGAEEMATTINEIAHNSDRGRQIAEEAVGQTNQAREQINELGRAAKQIGNVVETITDISEQVNLLALNATIEAARAGDAGKGFAVVANEIKELARQTAAASEEIKQQVEGIQNSTQDTVQEIVSIAEVVAKVNEIVSAISTAVEEQSVTTKDIADNVAQASGGVVDANNKIAEGSLAATSIAEDIAEVTQSSNEITSSSHQVNNNSKKLAALAEKLNTMVSQFKA